MGLGSLAATRHAGHAHVWDRAGLSRRQFMRGAAGVAGVAAGSRIFGLGTALAADASPNPIPGGLDIGGTVFHLFLPSAPGAGNEPSTITDFNGVVGLTEINGMGTDGEGNRLVYDVDMRFMAGEYVAAGGRHRQGTFGFV